MRRLSVTFCTICITLLLLTACAGAVDTGVVTGDNQPDSVGNLTDPVQTHLWGCYNIAIDPYTETVDVTPDRTVNFSANVVSFLNGNPMGVTVSNLEVLTGTGYVYCFLDINLRHPLPYEEYKGYDVRGIMLSNGSYTLPTGLSLPYSGMDQWLLNQDGLTRWFNRWEFPVSGLMGYTAGNIATPGYNPMAQLNPYKYFADDLSATEDPYIFLSDDDYEDHGVFSAGVTNSREYAIRFEMPPDGIGVQFGYAVVASWKGEDLVNDHPANASEPVACLVEITDDIWYESDFSFGGDLILDISVFDWDSEIVDEIVEDHTISISSWMIGYDYILDENEMIPVESGDHWVKYHVEISSPNVVSNLGHPFWVIIEDAGAAYECEFTPPGGAPDEPVQAVFESVVFPATEPYD